MSLTLSKSNMETKKDRLFIVLKSIAFIMLFVVLLLIIISLIPHIAEIMAFIFLMFFALYIFVGIFVALPYWVITGKNFYNKIF